MSLSLKYKIFNISILVIILITMYFYCFYGEDDSFLIHLKLRRFLTAFCVGAALSLSGVILQAVLKNPLADPFILGVAGASGFGITLALFTGLYVFINPVFIGFIISLGTVFFVVKVSSSKNKLSLYSAILTGFVFNSVYYSLILFLVSYSADITIHINIMSFLTGYVKYAAFGEIAVYFAVIIFFYGYFYKNAFILNLISLGEKSPYNLSQSYEKIKLVYLAAASLITALTVYYSGLIGFAGIIIPHFLRLVIGASHKKLLLSSFLAGGAFLTLSDFLSKTVLYPRDIPVGILIALIGAPSFLIVLKKTRRYRLD